VDLVVDETSWVTDEDFLSYVSRNDDKEKEKIKKVTSREENKLADRNHYKSRLIDKVNYTHKYSILSL
jgi:hypothetical protein